MKRITSFLLAIVLFAGLVLTGAPAAHAASEMTVSDALIAVLKKEEGFSAKPYWDYGQYTVGYGTRCPDDMLEEYQENGISEKEAETLLRNYLSATESRINKFIDKYSLTLTQGQFDALVTFTYNVGTSWINDANGTFHNAVKNGKTGSELIRAFSLWCNAGGSILPGLVRRRLCEANMYLNGEYSITKPSNYCYVYYNANGGSVSYRIQGYDANEGVAPAYKPTYSGHEFLGWYTAQTGGEKVTKLTKSLSGDTLYARWSETDKEEAETTPVTEVTVKVTTSGVNLRKGPGTNYSIVGTADKGDKLVITETASGSGYEWGNADGKWIALKYTNYQEVIKELEKNPEETTEATETTETTETTVPETTVPETTVPETTVPETTVPETTVPETTVPETTVPETTVPESTVPETTEPKDTKVTGKIKANGGLAVRKGPGTGYAVVKYLDNGTKVTITQQKKVGSMTWGKISSGWISMKYVVLDETESTAPEATTPEKEENEKVNLKGVITARVSLTVRKGPGTSYAKVGTVKEGAKVTITERKTANGIPWGKISTGWISMNYVKLTDGQTTPETTAPETTAPETTAPEKEESQKVNQKGVITAKISLTVRKGPGKSYAKVGTVKEGAKVTITERKTAGGIPWGKISSGWISMNYVKLTDGETTTETTAPKKEEAETTKLTGKVKVSDALSVRKGPGTSYAVKKYLKNGTKVTITEVKEVKGTKWGKISSGWICMDYVVLDGQKEDSSATKTVIADCLNVRKSASTSAKIVGYYYEGAKVTILETKKAEGITWGRTSKGWISMAYVK